MSSSKKPRPNVFIELHRELYGEFEGEDPLDDLPEDLKTLYEDITTEAAIRWVAERAPPDVELGPKKYMFEGFEALDAHLGGMGLVIEAHDPELERKIAIKLWKQSGPKAAAALRAEAKTLAKLNHPNVVRVYEVNRWNERVYFVMEWVEGCDGHQWLRSPRAPLEIRDVFVEAAKGLAAAHEAGIQHRDFKPSNILVGDDGRVLVADFGVAARLRAVDAEDSGPTRLAGTPPYIAPERLRGGRGNARSDQFAFCVALWEAFHGVRPYVGATPEELLEAIEVGEINVSPWTVDVPGWLSRAVRKGLAEDPELRHRDMYALIDALTNEPPEGEQPSPGSSDQEAGGAGGGGLLNAPAEDAPRGDGALLLPQSRPAPERRVGWWAFLGGLAGALVVGLVVALVPRLTSRPPKTAAGTQLVSDSNVVPGALPGEVDLPPYQKILDALEDDEFGEAEKLWRAHVRSDAAQRLNEEEALAIARVAFDRAKELNEAGEPAAQRATELAVIILGLLQTSSSDEAVRSTASGLYEKLLGFAYSRDSNSVEADH